MAKNVQILTLWGLLLTHIRASIKVKFNTEAKIVRTMRRPSSSFIIIIIIIINVAYVDGGTRGSRCVSPTAWPGGWHASRDSLHGEVLESHRIWSILRAWGLPERRLQSGADDQPINRCVLRSAMCAGTSLSSRAMCPKIEMRWAARNLPNGV